MGFKAVWGFDPEEKSNQAWVNEEEADPETFEAAWLKIPADFDSQVWELRRLFGL